MVSIFQLNTAAPFNGREPESEFIFLCKVSEMSEIKNGMNSEMKGSDSASCSVQADFECMQRQGSAWQNQSINQLWKFFILLTIRGAVNNCVLAIIHRTHLFLEVTAHSELRVVLTSVYPDFKKALLQGTVGLHLSPQI